jgi:hypothetical protein
VILWKVIQKAQRNHCGPPLPKEDRISILTIWKSLDLFHQKLNDHLEATKKQKEQESQTVQEPTAAEPEPETEEQDELFNPEDQVDYGKEDSTTETETETDIDTSSTGTSTDDDTSNNGSSEGESCDDARRIIGKDKELATLFAQIIDGLFQSKAKKDDHDEETNHEHEEGHDEVSVKEEPEEHPGHLEEDATADEHDHSEVDHADDTSAHTDELKTRRYFDEDTE